MKEVYLECLRLESWRAALIRELQTSKAKKINIGENIAASIVGRNRVRREEGSGVAGDEASNKKRDDYSNEIYNKLLKDVGQHLVCVRVRMCM